MSKSKGNGVDPLEVVDQYGADALRFKLITAGGTGNDRSCRSRASRRPQLREQAVERLALRDLACSAKARSRMPAGPPAPDAPVEDRWILSRVEGLQRSVDRLMQKFELGEAARQIYEFLWSEFSDWYIEIAKVRVRGERASDGPRRCRCWRTCSSAACACCTPSCRTSRRRSGRRSCSKIDGIDDEALIVAPYPRGESGYRDEAAEREMETLIDVVRAIRNIRAEKKVEPAKFIEAYVVADGARGVIEAGAPYIEMLARVRPLHIVGDVAEAPRDQVATAVLEGVTVVVPLAGLFDVERRARAPPEADRRSRPPRSAASRPSWRTRASAPRRLRTSSPPRRSGWRPCASASTGCTRAWRSWASPPTPSAG